MARSPIVDSHYFCKHDNLPLQSRFLTAVTNNWKWEKDENSSTIFSYNMPGCYSVQLETLVFFKNIYFFDRFFDRFNVGFGFV